MTSGRVAAHLVSKKHIDATQKRGVAPSEVASRETKSAPSAKSKKVAATAVDTSPTPSPPSDNGAPKTKKASKTAKASVGGIDLPRDPKDPSKYLCGICKVSLDATRAASHLSTDKHQRAEDKYLAAGMKGVGI